MPHGHLSRSRRAYRMPGGHFFLKRTSVKSLPRTPLNKGKNKGQGVEAPARRAFRAAMGLCSAPRFRIGVLYLAVLYYVR